MPRRTAVAEPHSGPACTVPAPAFTPAPEPPPTGRGRHRRRHAGSHRAACAVGYLRRSTDRQEQSIPDQRKAVEAYCAEHGLRLLRCYVDDGISGTSTVGRHAFSEMIAHAQGSTPDFGVIVAYDVKRFGRVDNDEAGYWRHLLRGCGVEVRYAAEGFSGDGTDDLLRPVKQWQAREESKDLSRVTIRGLLSKSTTGHWMGGAPPYGYDLEYRSQSGQFLLTVRYNADGTKAVLDEGGRQIRTLERGESIAVSRRDHCRLVPGDPARVETVRRIFRLYASEGLGFKATADRLNAEGVPTARNASWASHYSGLWSLTTVRAVLVNPAYCGDMAWNRRTDARFHRIGSGRAVERKDAHARRLESNDPGDWVVVRDAHEALVSRLEWERAQRMLDLKPESQSQRGVNQRTDRDAGPESEPDRRHRRNTQGGWTGPRSRFLLSGLVTCARCGSRYEGFTQRSRRRDEHGERLKTYFYACGGYIRHGPSVCSLGQVPQAELEEAVIAEVLRQTERCRGPEGRRLIEQEVGLSLGSEAEGHKEELGTVRARLEEVAATERRLLDSMTPGTAAAVERRLAELGEERNGLEARVEALERVGISTLELRRVVDETAAFAEELKAVLQDGSLSARRAALRRRVQAVTYAPGAGATVICTHL